MIYPDKKVLHYKLLSWYVNRILKNDFYSINIIGQIQKDNHSILLLTNHSTWWDGFWMMYLNNQLLKKNFYVLMLEKELTKRKFFTKSGAYSIDPENGNIKDSLVYTKKLLGGNENLVLFFPEGKFSPQSQNEKEFNRGVSFLYKSIVSFKTVFAVCITDYFKYRKPILNIYIEEKEFETGVSHHTIQLEYNLFFKNCIEKQKQFAE